MALTQGRFGVFESGGQLDPVAVRLHRNTGVSARPLHEPDGDARGKLLAMARRTVCCGAGHQGIVTVQEACWPLVTSVTEMRYAPGCSFIAHDCLKTADPVSAITLRL